jgi:glucose dehydrogenase
MNRLLSNSMLSMALGFCATSTYAQVTFDRLVNSAKEPQNWLTYSGDYSGHRFSQLDQINATNGKSLAAKWSTASSTVRRRTAVCLLWTRAPGVPSGTMSVNRRRTFDPVAGE